MKFWSLTSIEAMLQQAASSTCAQIVGSDRLQKHGYPTFGCAFNPEVGY